MSYIEFTEGRAHLYADNLWVDGPKTLVVLMETEDPQLERTAQAGAGWGRRGANEGFSSNGKWNGSAYNSLGIYGNIAGGIETNYTLSLTYSNQLVGLALVLKNKDEAILYRTLNDGSISEKILASVTGGEFSVNLLRTLVFTVGAPRNVANTFTHIGRGKIKDVALFDRVLSLDEIRDLINWFKKKDAQNQEL